MTYPRQVTEHAAAPEDARPRRRSERARVAILQATSELLHESGLEQLSIERVAARAGVGKQTIYRWWPNRAVLVADALLDRDDLDPTPPRDTGDVLADLSRWAGDLAASLGSPRGAATLRMLTAAATEDPDTSQRLHEKFSGPLQDQANARLAAAPALKATPAQRRNAIDAIIGYMVFRVLAHQELTRRDAVDMAKSVLLGLRSRSLTAPTPDPQTANVSRSGRM